MNAVGIRSVDDYHDASLDGLVGQKSTWTGGGSSRQRSGSRSYHGTSDFSNTSSIPLAPEVPRGPPISYPRSHGGNMNSPQRSFSQRAKGRPFAREALANDDEGFEYEPQTRIPQSESLPRREVRPESTGRSQVAAPLQLNTALPQQTSFKQNRSTPTQAMQANREVRPSPYEPEYDEPYHAPYEAPVQKQQEAYAPPSRSNTLQSPTYTSDANRHEWAPDRSPLQKLEVTLGDISKEEKRARVEEAEMLLREAKSGRGGRRATRDVATGAVPARGPSTRQSKIPVPATAPEASPRELEDTGLIRNLSTTQRDRIQHSTIVDTKKPDIRRLSGEGRRGFDYEEQAYRPQGEGFNSRAQADAEELQTPAVRNTSDRASLSNNRQLSQGQHMQSVRGSEYDAAPSKHRGQGYAPDLGGTERYLEPRHSDREEGRTNSIRQTSAPVPRGQGVPSNITRAVLMQGQTPQAQFPDDHEPPAQPLATKNANSSHKAALTVGAAGGAAALAGIGRSHSNKLQKSRPEGYGLSSSQRKSQEYVSNAVTPTTKRTLNPSQVYQNGGVSQPRTVSYQNAIDQPNESAQRQADYVGNNIPESPPIPRNVVSDPVIDSSPQTQPGKPRRQSVTFTKPFDARPKDEWKGAGLARLTLADMFLDAGVGNTKDQAWWEQDGGQRRISTSKSTGANPGYIDDKRAKFDPPLYLRCGPLLRYTGIRRASETTNGHLTQPLANDRAGNVKETWRGSVMIVTQDSQSNYKDIPVLRLFSRPKRLLPPPPQQIEGEELAPEYIDPIAGLMKLARNGQAIYVRPVDHLPEEKDLSRFENDDGLFEGSPSPLDTSEGNAPSAASTNKRTLDQDGESLGKYQEVRGVRLYADPVRDVTFWRFNLEVELGDTEQHIAYRINRGPAQGFWVPGRGQSMNIMFHTCNGFSMSVNPDMLSGPDPMWRDVLNNHEFRPFHVMIGGGDQVYNDGLMVETQHFGSWTRIKNPHHKHQAPFNSAMKEELEDFYLRRYSMWFSQGLFSLANAQIPMVNMWDDHDIIDGFGSYPDHFMRSAVIKGLGSIAYKYYLLFQHQSVPEETTADEPSWVMGRHPGPYIEHVSRSIFIDFGSSIAFLGLDCRTERRRDEIIALDTYDDVFERLRKDVIEGQTKHLIVLLGVPIAYPRLVWLENVLTSRAMDPIKALSRAGFLKGSLMNKFDGGVEILDDMDDHWTARDHKDERNIFIKDLQDLAAEKSVRITILSGDVHLAAIGQFYSQPKLGIPKDRDHRYMPNVISSAIVNMPPPEMLADILNKRNKVHHLDKYTEEDMIPMFTHDVDGRRRNNKTLLPRRNWCSVREYNPGSTPAPTPPTSEPGSDSEMDDSPQQNRPSQGRRFSFTRKDVNPRNLLRRLSTRNAPPSSYRDTMDYQNGRGQQRPASFSGSQPQNGWNGNSGSLPNVSVPQRASSSSSHQPNMRGFSDTELQGPKIRPGFHRRPTNLSEKAAKKGNVMAIDKEGNEFDVNDHVNLEGGLDIVLNCEINHRDPAGITTPYRLLVPALWYDGSSDREKLDDTEHVKDIQRRPTLLGRMGIGSQKSRSMANNQGKGNWGQGSETESSSGNGDHHDQPPRRRFGVFGSRKRKDDHYRDDGYMDENKHPKDGPRASHQGNSLSPNANQAQAAALPSQRDVDPYDQLSKPHFGLFNSFRRRRQDDYSDDDYTDEEDEKHDNQVGAHEGDNKPPITEHRQDALLPGQKNGAALRAAEGVRPVSRERQTPGQRDISSGGYVHARHARGYGDTPAAPPKPPSSNRQMFIAGPLSQAPAQSLNVQSPPFQQDLQSVQQHYDVRGQQSYNNQQPPQVYQQEGPQIPQRRQSKQERILGMNQTDFQPPGQMPLRGNGIIGRGYNSDSQQSQQQQSPPPRGHNFGMRHTSTPVSAPAPPRRRGYDGIEAYTEPKARRRWSLSKAKGRKWIGDGSVPDVD